MAKKLKFGIFGLIFGLLLPGIWFLVHQMPSNAMTFLWSDIIIGFDNFLSDLLGISGFATTPVTTMLFSSVFFLMFLIPPPIRNLFKIQWTNLKNYKSWISFWAGSLIAGLIFVSLLGFVISRGFPPFDNSSNDFFNNQSFEVVFDKKINCNGEYVFVSTEDGGRIYKSKIDPDNLVAELPKALNKRETLLLFHVPKKNCDRVFFTKLVKNSRDPAVQKGIFSWEVGSDKIEELKVGQYSSSLGFNTTGSLPISSDGTKLLVANLNGKKIDSCYYRTLRLLDLKKDSQEVLVNLSNDEALSNGILEHSIYCKGLDFGWKDENIIYYKVYDATVDGNRPVLGERTLDVN